MKNVIQLICVHTNYSSSFFNTLCLLDVYEIILTANNEKRTEPKNEILTKLFDFGFLFDYNTL